MNNAFTLLTGAEQQLNKKKKIKKPAANGTPAQASATATTVPPIMQSSAPVSVVPLSTDLVVGVNEACAIFERAAREAKTASDKVKLWKEWTRLVGIYPRATCNSNECDILFSCPTSPHFAKV